MKKRSIFAVAVAMCAFLVLLTGCAGTSSDYSAGIASKNATANKIDAEGDSFNTIIENEYISTAEEPSSYFSIDMNTSSYPYLRRAINGNYEISKDAVRVEEMLNYFNYDYETPENEIMALTASVFDNPHDETAKILTIGLATQKIEYTEQRNNLVFLIDTSGSMYGSDRLDLVKQAFILLAQQLNENDRISLVTYAGDSRTVLQGVKGSDKQIIIAAVEGLESGGSTNGGGGIERAYALAQQNFISDGNNRVILMTDGDFNVGNTSTEGLKKMISEYRNTGIYFSGFGVGVGNARMELMETLALNGNGTASYLDSLNEAKRALVEQIGGTLVTVAKDVKAGITFNPEYVSSYRLVGYENKLLTEEEFNDEDTDAGEIGSGYTLTVAYEIKLTDKALADGNFGQVCIKYKPTSLNHADANETDMEINLDVATSAYHEQPTQNDIFVASVIEFAMILRDSKFKGTADVETIIRRMEQYTWDEDKAEFLELLKTYRNNSAQQEQ